MAKWFIQGRPYNCNQCGKLCFQGLMHKCAKALPVGRIRVGGMSQLDAPSAQFNRRLKDGFQYRSNGD